MESEGHGGGDGDNMGYTSVGGDSSKKSTCTKTTELKNLGKPLCTVKWKWKNQIKKPVQRFKKDAVEISYQWLIN